MRFSAQLNDGTPEVRFERAPYSDTSKTRAFGEAAKGLGLEPFLPNLAVTFANEGEAEFPNSFSRHLGA